MNVSLCRYEVVREVAREEFEMKLQEHDAEDFDILWSDGAVQP